MKNAIHTSLTISEEEEKQVLHLLKGKYYQNETDKKMFMDSMKFYFWWKELLGKLPTKYNDEKVKKVIENWAEKVKMKVKQ